MPFLLSYADGCISYGLSTDIDVAMAQAEERCDEAQKAATIVDRATYRVVARINLIPSGLYQAKKEDQDE